LKRNPIPFVTSAVLPLVAAWMLHVPRVALGNFTDAVFYLSYARQFQELVLRHGFLYYATRFGGILPDAASGGLFGDITGIWILRWFLTAAVSASLFHFFRKRYGLLAGLLASVFWSFNPAALRLICTTYVDSSAVPFLILGCCLFGSGLGGWAAGVIAGVLFALAASAHLYAAFALLLLAPWLIASRWGQDPKMLTVTAWTALGFFGTFAAAWLWYLIVWGMPAIFSPTVEVMKGLSGGQAALWKKPLGEALHDAPAWFAPLVMLPAVTVCAIPGSWLLRGSALSLMATTAFFWGGDLFGSAYVLSMPFYYSFLLPVSVLTVATLCGELLKQTETARQRAALLSTLLIAGAAPAVAAHEARISPVVIFATCVAILLLLCTVPAGLRGRLTALLCIESMAVATFFVSSTGMFSQLMGHYVANDVPVLELAGALREELPKANEDARITRFWYDDEVGTPPASDRRMIGAFWLHNFSKLSGAGGGFVAFPRISQEDAAIIDPSGVDRIVVFDQDESRLNEALKSIGESGLPFLESRRFKLTSKSDSCRSFNVAVVERKSQKKSKNTELFPLQNIEGCNHGMIKGTAEGVGLTSNSTKWSEFARIPLGDVNMGDEVHLRCRISRGLIRFSMNGKTETDLLHFEKWASEGTQEIVIISPKDLGQAFVSLQNMYPNGSKSGIEIEHVEILRVKP